MLLDSYWMCYPISLHAAVALCLVNDQLLQHVMPVLSYPSSKKAALQFNGYPIYIALEIKDYTMYFSEMTLNTTSSSFEVATV